MALFTFIDFMIFKTVSSVIFTGLIFEPQYGIDGGFIPSGTCSVELLVKTFANKLACEYGFTTKVPSALFNAGIDVLEILATEATIWNKLRSEIFNLAA